MDALAAGNYVLQPLDDSDDIGLYVIESPGKEVMRISSDYNTVTFTLIDPPMTFTWEELKEFLQTHRAINQAT